MDNSKNKIITLVFRQLVKEHGIILQYLISLDRFLQELPLKEFLGKLAAIEKDLLHEVRDHFDFEEKVLFPTVLQGDPPLAIIQLVLNLQRAHGRIAAWVESLFELVGRHRSGGRATKRELQVLASNLLHEVRHHVKIEIESLHPYLENHPHGPIAMAELMEERKRAVLAAKG